MNDLDKDLKKVFEAAENDAVLSPEEKAKMAKVLTSHMKATPLAGSGATSGVNVTLLGTVAVVLLAGAVLVVTLIAKKQPTVEVEEFNIPAVVPVGDQNAVEQASGTNATTTEDQSSPSEDNETGNENHEANDQLDKDKTDDPDDEKDETKVDNDDAGNSDTQTVDDNNKPETEINHNKPGNGHTVTPNNSSIAN